VWRDVTQGNERVGMGMMGMMSVGRCYSDVIKGKFGRAECGEMLLMGNERQG